PDLFLRGVSGNVATLGLQELEAQGHIEKAGSNWQLTQSGAELAKTQAHNVLLWDIYRQYNAELDLPLIAEDRQRDIRELLSNDVIETLENKLAEVVA
ncbi:MAG: hypothetical protein AAF633_19460, partial [Chloroflexota bacterium]